MQGIDQVELRLDVYYVFILCDLICVHMAGCEMGYFVYTPSSLPLFVCVISIFLHEFIGYTVFLT